MPGASCSYVPACGELCPAYPHTRQQSFSNTLWQSNKASSIFLDLCVLRAIPALPCSALSHTVCSSVAFPCSHSIWFHIVLPVGGPDGNLGDRREGKVRVLLAIFLLLRLNLCHSFGSQRTASSHGSSLLHKTPGLGSGMLSSPFVFLAS